LHVFSDEIEHLRMSLRIRDVSRAPESWGTAIPVVTEKDALCNAAHFFGMPTGPDQRVNVRIYDFASFGPQSYKLRVYDHDSDELLRTVDVYTSGTATVFEPSYVLLSNVTFTLRSRLARIEIEPTTFGPLFWAFATVTNNATQHVTAIAPESLRSPVEFGRCVQPAI
jgi:hypothetical protein